MPAAGRAYLARMAKQNPHFELSRECAAPPEAVYDLLANLRSHLDWGGARQSSDFRLLTMETASEAAGAGTRFRTTGTIPMSARRWNDESVVTVADRPAAFEFVTDARAGTMAARYRHRYEMARTAAGCTVSYTMVEESLERPMLRLALPGIRRMMWRAGIPMFAGRGFRNLLASAESVARHGTPAFAGAGVGK